jgi:hypothetical protein
VAGCSGDVQVSLMPVLKYTTLSIIIFCLKTLFDKISEIVPFLNTEVLLPDP